MPCNITSFQTVWSLLTTFLCCAAWTFSKTNRFGDVRKWLSASGLICTVLDSVWTWPIISIWPWLLNLRDCGQTNASNAPWFHSLLHRIWMMKDVEEILCLVVLTFFWDSAGWANGPARVSFVVKRLLNHYTFQNDDINCQKGLSKSQVLPFPIIHVQDSSFTYRPSPRQESPSPLCLQLMYVSYHSTHKKRSMYNYQH